MGARLVRGLAMLLVSTEARNFWKIREQDWDLTLTSIFPQKMSQGPCGWNETLTSVFSK
jgi:hypothetical protein